MELIHRQRLTLEPAEIFIIGNLNFPNKWNRYNMFRVHNFSETNRKSSIQFGYEFKFKSCRSRCSCRCIRRELVNGNYVYTQGYNYLQKMLPNFTDPIFFNKQYYNQIIVNGFSTFLTNNTNLSYPLGSFNFIDGKTGRNYNPTQYWQLPSTLYGSLYPSPSSLTKPIGDFLVNNGDLLAVRWITTSGHNGGTVGGSARLLHFKFGIFRLC